MSKTIVRLATVALVAATASACASSAQRYQDKNMDFGSVRTVAVMPFQNLSRDNLAGDRVRDVFVSALLASEAVYVVPNGEVARAIAKVNVPNATAPSADEIVKLGAAMKAEAVITGTVKEYGEVRSGTAAGNAISVSLQMHEASTGKVVWSATSTKGGVSVSDRLFGGGGVPMNYVTEEAVDDLLNKLFK